MHIYAYLSKFIFYLKEEKEKEMKYKTNFYKIIGYYSFHFIFRYFYSIYSSLFYSREKKNFCKVIMLILKRKKKPQE